MSDKSIDCICATVMMCVGFVCAAWAFVGFFRAITQHGPKNETQTLEQDEERNNA